MRRAVFVFQAEDGIRDLIVTGVQTCALPISASTRWLVRRPRFARRFAGRRRDLRSEVAVPTILWTPRGEEEETAQHEQHRSEERRVGKECRSRWSPDH